MTSWPSWAPHESRSGGSRSSAPSTAWRPSGPSSASGSTIPSAAWCRRSGRCRQPTWRRRARTTPSSPSCPTASRSRWSSASTPDEGRVTIDLRDNIDCVDCGLNESEACAVNNVLCGFFNCLGPEIPHNGGSFQARGRAAARRLRRRPSLIPPFHLDGDDQCGRPSGQHHSLGDGEARRRLRPRRGRQRHVRRHCGDQRQGFPARRRPLRQPAHDGGEWRAPPGPRPMAGSPTCCPWSRASCTGTAWSSPR